jgi:PBP1b-binding outer membrane lipoprotein LpoB
MKKLRLKTVAMILFAAVSLTACSNDDDQPQEVTKTSFVSAIAGPTTGIPNQELSFTVSYAVENNCGTFNKFVETTVENTKQIELQSKYEGTGCGTTPVTKTTTYKMKPTAEGTYILKFKKTASEFVTQTIVVKKAS